MPRTLFGRLLPRYRRLLRDGARAEAVILTWKASPLNGWCTLRLRVHYPGGETREIVRLERDERWAFAGARVAMRYDPADHSRVEIDLDVADFDQALEDRTARDAQIDRAEKEIAHDDALRSPAARHLAELGELHRTGVITDAEFEAKKAELLRRL